MTGALGALGESRPVSAGPGLLCDDFVAPRAGCVGTTGCRPAQRYGLIYLTRLEVGAFSRFQKRSAAQRLSFAAAMALSLCVYQRRVHAGGAAVCLLEPRRARVVAGLLGTALVLGGAGYAFPAAAAVLMAVVAGVFAPAAVLAVRAIPARRRLRWRGPTGDTVYLHSLAGKTPGAGAELMRTVAGEADSKGWLLVLDADNERLARYYEGFGFARRGAPVAMPNGGRMIRMWRPIPQRARRP